MSEAITTPETTTTPEITTPTTLVTTETTPEIKETPVQESANPNNPELDEFLKPAASEKTEKVVESDRPEWLPENFKAPEELAKSYKEAQAELTKKAQELAETKKIADQLKQQTQQNEFQGIVSTVNTTAIEAVDKGFKDAIEQVNNAFAQSQISETEKIYRIEAIKEQRKLDVDEINSGRFAEKFLKENGYNPKPQEQGQPNQQLIERYGEPVVIDDFVKQNAETINLPYKSEVFNQIKTLYGNKLGAKELQTIKLMVDTVEKGTEARIRNEYELKSKQDSDVSRLGSVINTLPSGGTEQGYFTRKQIADPVFFAKHEPEIDKAMAEGRIK